MNISSLIAYLKELPNQEAAVFVVEHHDGRGYYNQGGNASEVKLDPTKHLTYTMAAVGTQPPVDPPTLLIGAINLSP